MIAKFNIVNNPIPGWRKDMTNTLKKIALTETTLAIAFAGITLLLAEGSADRTRLLIGLLLSARVFVATGNIVLKNLKLINWKVLKPVRAEA
jgi:hypothetical protein